MTNEQARKLLGGYATNSLSEAERKALFEAALDDQELFDALQQEQALKELLADPASRPKIQRALGQKKEAAARWRRPWAWGGLAGAVAAAVLIVAVIRTNQPRAMESARLQISPELAAPVPPPLPAAPIGPAPQPEERNVRPGKGRLASAPARKKDEAQADALKTQPRTAAPAPPPPPPAPAAPVPSEQAHQLGVQETVQVQSGAGQVGPTPVQAAPQPAFPAAPGRRDSALRAALGGAMPANSPEPLLRYSLVRRDPSGAYSPLPAGATLSVGDSIRLVVRPGVAGYLSLYEFEGGQWNKLLPPTDRVLLVAADGSQTIPDAPIVVKESEQRLRLILAPAAGDAAKGVVDLQSRQAGWPLVVEITITAGKYP